MRLTPSHRQFPRLRTFRLPFFASSSEASGDEYPHHYHFVQCYRSETLNYDRNFLSGGILRDYVWLLVRFG